MKKNNTNCAKKLGICQCGCDTWHNEAEPLRTIQGHKITGITQAKHLIGNKKQKAELIVSRMSRFTVALIRNLLRHRKLR